MTIGERKKKEKKKEKKSASEKLTVGPLLSRQEDSSEAPLEEQRLNYMRASARLKMDSSPSPPLPPPTKKKSASLGEAQCPENGISYFSF